MTAVIALPPTLALIWLGGWPCAALASVASVLACREFLRLSFERPSARDGVALVAAGLLPWLPVWAPASAIELAVVVLAATSVAAWTWHVVRQDIEGAARAAPLLLQAVVFCALGLFFVSLLRATAHGREWTLAAIAVTFANDTGAFVAGKLLGRHHMLPRVSPGKTWEGFAGGAVASLGLASLAREVWPEAFGWPDVAALTLACSAFGPLGDLAKSALKRARGVKDAGALLPGHGGMLDRIDALLVNAPLIWAWARWGH